MLIVRLAIARAAFHFLDFAALAAFESFTMLTRGRSVIRAYIEQMEDAYSMHRLTHPPRRCRMGDHKFRMRAGHRLLACERCGRVKVRRATK